MALTACNSCDVIITLDSGQPYFQCICCLWNWWVCDLRLYYGIYSPFYPTLHKSSIPLPVLNACITGYCSYKLRRFLCGWKDLSFFSLYSHNPVIKKKKSTRRAVVSPIQVSKPVLNKKAVSSGKSNLVMNKHKVLPRIGGDKVNKPSGKVAAVKPDKKKQLAIPSPPKAG